MSTSLEVHRVVLEQDLKREYQEFLRTTTATAPTATDDPTAPRRRSAVGGEHELPYFDDRVHFPDFRIEYEVDGRERHEDVEVLTQHYRGAHAAGRAQQAFVSTASTGGGGGVAPHPRLAEELL